MFVYFSVLFCFFFLYSFYVQLHSFFSPFSFYILPYLIPFFYLFCISFPLLPFLPAPSFVVVAVYWFVLFLIINYTYILDLSFLPSFLPSFFLIFGITGRKRISRSTLSVMCLVM